MSPHSFFNFTALRSTPQIEELMNKVAAKCLDKWMMIGLQLKIDQQLMNAIPNKEATNAFSVVFHQWKNNGDPPFTWATIIDVLRKPIVGENQLAYELEEWLRQKT